MVNMRMCQGFYRQRGVSLIEVLVTIVILSIGLLGMAGLQSRLQQSEMEAYQRSQALLLLDDMANRIASNRANASSYVTGATNPLGVGALCPTNTGSRQQRDTSEWCSALQGASETLSGSNVGAMIGGRGCIESLGGNSFLITVVWQGLTPISAPPVGVACGEGSYDGPSGSVCTDDLCRRAVTTIVQVATL